MFIGPEKLMGIVVFAFFTGIFFPGGMGNGSYIPNSKVIPDNTFDNIKTLPFYKLRELESKADPLTIDEAMVNVELYLEKTGYDEFILVQIRESHGNYYILLEDSNDQGYEFELIVDKHTGKVKDSLVLL